VVLTIGHSTRAIEEFTGLLQRHGVRRLVDVRSMPKSRYNPQFNREELERSLGEAGIAYTHLPALGGLRRARADSPNTGWKNGSFRGYADHMQTAEFQAGMESLMEMAAAGQIAVMCAEAVPWQCHRSMIADALVVRGVDVEHIIGEKGTQPHKLTSFARVKGQEITYPPDSLPLWDSGRELMSAKLVR